MPSLKAVAVGVGLVAAALVADRVSQVWASLLESNVLIFIFVGLLLAVALYSTGTNGQAFGGSTGATTSQQIVPRRPHLGSSSTSGNANSPVQTPRRPTETAQRSRRRVITDVPSFMQPSGSGGSINASAGSNANDAALVASGSTGGGGGSSNTALVAVDDLSNALVESASLSCPAPHGCGFRHTCPDLGRSWMRCKKHGHHMAPPDGSVWRERVDEDQAGAGQLRLCLSWRGRVLDVTEVGECRGWEKEMTDRVLSAMTASGRRLGDVCSLSHPLLDKLGEVLTMDPRAAAEGAKWWNLWKRRSQGPPQPSTPPLAIELPSMRAGRS